MENDVFQQALMLTAAGDTQAIHRLAASGALSGLADAEKNGLVQTAALNGRCAILRALFERYHLTGADPDAQGRTLLHFAAQSGDEETTAFVTEVLGFDPLTGDAQGRTPLDDARAASRPGAYNWLVRRLGFGAEECYRNPILRGFHPDPSILRVGEDYYLVNSSFVLFPGLPVSHSRDLVHWRVVGHAVENLAWSGLEGLPGGFGYWAPDISYFMGRFWVAATLRRNTPPYRLQMITSAPSPQGPWDKPRFLPLNGIDPSLFTDDDGRRYILLNPGAVLAEISESGELISEPRMIYYGSARIKPEGPHLLKKDGWYYLFLAEGGTGPEHMETVMRSRALLGPYEACPYNPILGRKNPLSPIQRSGHGKPVSTPDGRWYMAYLCGRSVEGKTVMGRETALDPITWTADGWPLVNALKGPSCQQRRPFPDSALPAARNDEWLSPRTDPRSFARFDGGVIRLACGADPGLTGPCSVLARRQTEAAFSQRAHVDITEAEPGSMAGLAGYYDERSFFLFGLRKSEEGCALELLEQIGRERRQTLLCGLPGPACDIAVEGEGLERKLFLLIDGTKKRLHVFRADYLSDEGVPEGKRFTGALVGLAALGSGSAVFSDYADVMHAPVI